MQNYSVVDLVGASTAVLLFAPLILPLGYVLGWFTNTFQFRTLTAPWRILGAVALSTAITPTIAFWASWLGRWPGAWILFGLLLLVALLLLVGIAGHEKLPNWLSSFRGIGYTPVVIVVVWCVAILLAQIDLQIGDRLYYNVSSFDHSLRTEFTHAITRTGVPPSNPLYHLGASSPLRYHYFWFILCSMVEQAGGSVLNARHTMMASIVWAGFGLMSTVPLYFRFFYPQTGERLRRTSIIGVLLLGVTGLDILPNIFYFFHWHYLFPDMEWWNSPVCAWVSSIIWVPHQIVSLVGCLIGFLLIWQAVAEKTLTYINSVLAGISFATAAGTSVFVTMVFAAFLLVWALYCFRRRRAFIPVMMLAGIVSAVAIAPHLLHLVGRSGGGALLKIQLRQFGPFERFVQYHHVPRALRLLARLVLLPLNYFLEFGFFFVAGWWFFRHRGEGKFSDANAAAVIMLATSVVICTLFSSALVNNDLGVRGFMQGQFVLLLWGAEWIASWRLPKSTGARTHAFAKSLLAIGACGTVYAVLLFRFYGVATDAGLSRSEFFPHGEAGKKTFAFRQAYEQLRRMLPPGAIVQTNPTGRFNDFPFGLYALRQAAAVNDTCGAEFGGDPGACRQDYSAIAGIFNNKQHPSLNDVAGLCRRYGIDALVMRSTDGAWQDHSSWMWQTQPAIANDYVRVYLFEPRKNIS